MTRRAFGSWPSTRPRTWATRAGSAALVATCIASFATVIGCSSDSSDTSGAAVAGGGGAGGSGGTGGGAGAGGSGGSGGSGGAAGGTAGILATGDFCTAADVCARGACDIDPSGCGTCVTLEAGDPCVVRCFDAGGGQACTQDCGPDLACASEGPSSGTCVERIPLGAECDQGALYNPCELGAYCERLPDAPAGECLPMLSEGEPCGTFFGSTGQVGNARGTKECDIRASLTCLPVFFEDPSVQNPDEPAMDGFDFQSRCVSLDDLLVGVGQACGDLSFDLAEAGPRMRFCEPGTYCSDLLNSGTCVAAAAEGASCELNGDLPDAVCAGEATCVDGTCVVPTEASCGG